MVLGVGYTGEAALGSRLSSSGDRCPGTSCLPISSAVSRFATEDGVFCREVIAEVSLAVSGAVKGLNGYVLELEHLLSFKGKIRGDIQSIGSVQ